MSRCADNSSRGSAVPPTARYSTLQDIDAGRHTEIDMFSGAMMRMGKKNLELIHHIMNIHITSSRHLKRRMMACLIMMRIVRL